MPRADNEAGSQCKPQNDGLAGPSDVSLYGVVAAFRTGRLAVPPENGTHDNPQEYTAQQQGYGYHR